MTQEQLEHFQALLEAEKLTLQQELSLLGKKVDGNDWMISQQEQDEPEPDYVDQADIVEDFENRIGKLNELEKQYHDVVSALSKFKQGTYGICEVSGNAIELDRLEANPSAKTCKAHMND